MGKIKSIFLSLVALLALGHDLLAQNIPLLGAGGGGGGGSLALVSPPIIGTATYSNANLTVAMTANSVSIQANRALVGKKVFSVSFDISGGNDAIVGVTSIGGNTNIPGFDGNRSFGYYSSGAVWLNSATVVSPPAFIQAAQVGIAIDVTNSLAWVTMDGTNYYGSIGPLTVVQVAAGISGLNIAAITATGTLFAAVAEDVIGNQMTLQTAYPYIIPIGFTQY